MAFSPFLFYFSMISRQFLVLKLGIDVKDGIEVATGRAPAPGLRIETSHSS